MRFDSSAKFALVVAAATLLASGLGFAAAARQYRMYLQKEPVELRGPLSTMPASAGTWEQVGKDQLLSAAVVEELGTDKYLDRWYVRGGKPSEGIHLHLAYYTGMIDAVPHVPERCTVAGGLEIVEEASLLPLTLDSAQWRVDDGPANRATGERYRLADAIDPITRVAESVRLPIGDIALRTIEFQSETRPEERLLVGYFFIANGRATPSALDVRKLAFQRTDRYAYFCKVQLSMPARSDDGARRERFGAMATEILDQLLPHVMRRLPDWPEIESRTPSS